MEFGDDALMDDQEMRVANKKLMDQVEYIFEHWQRYGMNSSSVHRALHGLFDLVEEFDPDGMRAAYFKGRGKQEDQQ